MIFRGGSSYDNGSGSAPASASATRRRAMLGCKFDNVRAAVRVANERECNVQVLEGGVFARDVADAVAKLNCPTCLNGIDASRKL